MVATKTSASNGFKMRMLLSGTLLLTGVTLVTAQEPVSWINRANVSLRGDRLEKTGGCDGCDDAGAVSRQIIRSGDGAVEFRVDEDDTLLRAGLSHTTVGRRFGNIDFAVRLNGNGRADVMESGAYVGGDTEYRAGDVFRVEVAAGRVRYLKNGQVMHMSQKWPAYPLVFDVALGSVGATIADARMETRDSVVGTSGISDAFERLDRNGDGVVSRREWVGTRASFNRRDANRDGFLTRREIDFDDRPAVGTSGSGDFIIDDEFRRLDRNDDGVVSRREWGGTPGSFNQRDANRDGLLTRREIGLDGPAAVGTSGYGDFIVVRGTDQWTDTGLTLRPGDRVTFNAQGTIQMSPDPNDTASPAGSRRLAPEAPLRQQSAGTLIAQIGGGAPISVGASRTITARGGRLLLGVNDDYVGDNSGEFRVEVSIEPR